MEEKEKQLKKAISILYDMELNNYKMTRTIQRLNYEISCLGHPQEFYTPERKYAALNNDWTTSIGCLGVILGAILGGASGCSSTTSFFGSIESGIGGLIGGGIGGFLIGALIGLMFEAIGKANRDSEYEQTYEKEMEVYNTQVERDNKRVEKELKKQKILIAERDALIKRRNKSQEILNGFYMRVGIDKMFRSLIPIGKMNEIIGLNITSSLEGQNGLNDRVRKELREDAFYIKLDEISQKLDVVISKQDRIYNELMSIHSQCENLIDATIQSAQIAANNNKLLSEAVENTRIAAYNSERIAIEENYQSFLMTYKF